MATYTVRGNAHNIVYRIKTEEGDDKQQWETYDSKLEALQRKAYIDDLQEKRCTPLFMWQQLNTRNSELNSKLQSVRHREMTRLYLYQGMKTTWIRLAGNSLKNGCRLLQGRRGFHPTPMIVIGATWTTIFFRILETKS